MSIGIGLFLLVVGAILTFALKDSLGGVDLGIVGVILMTAGAAGLALSLLLRTRRRYNHQPRSRQDVIDNESETF